MQNIAVVIPKYGLVGGAEQFASELTGTLSGQTGYNYHVFANRWQTSSDAIIFHKVPLVSFPKFLTTISFAYFVRRKLSAGNFALVHSHERIFAADIFTLHGVPHRFWIHQVRRKKMSLYDLATAWVEKKLVQEGKCKKFIAVSSLTKDIFIQEYNVDPEKVAVIHPGVNLDDYKTKDKELCRAQARKEYGLNPDDKVIIFASMNFEIKGLDAIIAALAGLKARGKSLKLVIVGKGNKGKYYRIASQAGIADDVIFTGTLKKEKLIRLYLAGDIYMMLSQFDTFGMVVLEAMAAGLPVIISSNVGARDLVREGNNGFVIKDTLNTDYIADKICLTLKKNANHEMSGFALDTAAQNTWEAVMAKYQTVYADIIAQRERKIG